ncbi:uncharacterized protein JCM15063_002024 [Sporobolomyces koalae]|uniref:uncharacterized protein n=1 Tax=Sporobolomyces koalae TaxID=500713 RepID=UPI003178C169
MKFLTLLTLALSGAAVSAAVVPPRSLESSGEPHSLEKRQGHCHNGMTTVLAYNNKLVCIGSRDVWVGAAITSIGQNTVQTVASRVTDWIASSVYGQRDTSQVRRLARRDVGPDSDVLYVEVAGVQAAVPFVEGANGSTTISVLDFIARSGTALVARDVADSEPTVVGGTATFDANGYLENFTLDFAVPAASYESESGSPALAKRSYWSLHTTYWANYDNARTSLNWNDIHALVLSSYGSLPSGVSQTCGYMANSGTWHGAFRHWTGDSGYQVGECQSERNY